MKMARVASSAVDHPTALADVDTLFEKHSIKEIHEISKKIQAEIEKNKEDVRQMVGERYRDLIEAADTITEMKITIQQITKNINSMENQCSLLQQHDITASPLQDAKNLKRKQKFEQYYALAIQVKLLLDIPEKFWDFVEAGSYLSATELFLLAKHIHANLQFAVTAGIPVTLWFPIVSRQISITNQFKNTLINVCESKLRNPSITGEELVQCICTLLILGNRNIEETFEDFLTARLKCIENLYNPSKHDISVKDQVCGTISIIINTFHLIYFVFYENSSQDEAKKSLLEKTLHRINETEVPLMLVAQMGSPAAKYIPKSVIDFRMPRLNSPMQINSDYLQEHCLRWIDQIIEFIQKNLPKLLHYITNIRGLSFVCDAVWEVIKENESTQMWTDICENLLHRPLFIWTEIFRSLFLKQIEMIIQSYLASSFDTTQQQIFGFLDNIARNGDNRSSIVERDVSSFLWTEFDDFVSNNSADKENLIMKSKGFTPFTQSICMTLNSHLTTLLDDLLTFQQDFNLDSENSEVQKFLTTAVADNIQKMIENCRKTVANKRPTENKNLHDPSVSCYITCVLVLSRIWRALIEICPSIEKCLNISSSNSNSTTISRSFIKQNEKVKNEFEDSVWLSVRNSVNEECLAMMRLWKEIVMDHYNEKMSNMIRLWTPEEALLFIPQWDSIKIQEETEDGEPVTSTIRIPAHASSLVYNTLYQLCTEINSIGGHTLSRHILEELQHDLIRAILQAYESLVVQQMTQITAIQLLFDLQFICTICGVKDDKEFSSQILTISNKLENCIDPFDFDVFSPHIQANLRRCIQRSSVLFGALINPNKTNLGTYIGRTTALTSQQEQHGILLLNTSAPRFCLLPVGDGFSDSAKSPSTGNKKVESNKSDLPFSTAKTSGTSNAADSAKSTASYLFEAMSSSWFRN